MNKVNITDIKNFMSKLLVREDFDEFLLREANIVTYSAFSIDGRIKEAFYSAEEYEALDNKDFIEWRNVKTHCFNIIKGKKLPVSFKITLKMNLNETIEILKQSGSSININDIEGLLINIKYENNTLDCITATSLYTFTIDKSLENYFDKYIEKILLAL